MDFSFANDVPSIRTSSDRGSQPQVAIPLPIPAHGSALPSTNNAGTSRSFEAPTSAATQETFGHQRQFNAAVDPNCIVVSKRQEGNPVLKHIRKVRWVFGDITPDYIMGASTCAIFLSLRFHLLKPEYIHHRIRELQRSFRLRVLLCHVDVDDVVEPLGQVIKAALLSDCTLICGWSPEECARYLETYKSYENKPPDAIQGRAGEDYISKLNSVLTTIRSVNRTDVATLGAAFRTAANIMNASFEELSACAGIGPTKVRRLYDTFHEPFRKSLATPSQPAAAARAGVAGGNRSGEGGSEQLPGGLGPAEGAGEILLLDDVNVDSDEELAAYDMLD